MIFLIMLFETFQTFKRGSYSECSPSQKGMAPLKVFPFAKNVLEKKKQKTSHKMSVKEVGEEKLLDVLEYTMHTGG